MRQPVEQITDRAKRYFRANPTDCPPDCPPDCLYWIKHFEMGLILAALVRIKPADADVQKYARLLCKKLAKQWLAYDRAAGADAPANVRSSIRKMARYAPTG